MSAADAGEGGVEAELARRIVCAPPGQARDAEAELYRRLAPRAHRYGLRHLRDEQAAADLMQHVMALTLEQLRDGRLREPERVVSFVLGACRMTALDMQRTARRRETLLQRYGETLTAAEASLPAFDHTRVADCMARLSERERSVLLMSFHEERAADEVARTLGLSAGNVRVIRHRGIAKLRDCIQSGRRCA